MEEPTAATARKPARGPSLRRLVWSTIWFCLAAWLLIRLPHEVSYWMLALAEKASVEGRTDDALAWVERAKEWTPESSLPRKVTALILQKAGKLDELGRIDLVLQDDDLKPADKAELHLEKSEIFRRKRRWDDAITEFDKAADFKGELRPSGKRFALLMLAGRADEAAREVEQLLKTSSDPTQTAKLHFELSAIYRGQKRWEEALREFDAAVELKPDLGSTPEHVELLLLTGKREEAKQELPAVEGRLASSWRIRRVDIDNLMAYFMALIGDDLDLALQRVEQSLKWDGDSEAYLDTRAFVLYRLGRYDEALPDAERAVASIERKFAEKDNDAEARKNVAVIIYHRSLILEALGKSSEAERDRARVRDLGFEPDERLF